MVDTAKLCTYAVVDARLVGLQAYGVAVSRDGVDLAAQARYPEAMYDIIRCESDMEGDTGRYVYPIDSMARAIRCIKVGNFPPPLMRLHMHAVHPIAAWQWRLNIASPKAVYQQRKQHDAREHQAASYQKQARRGAVFAAGATQARPCRQRDHQHQDSRGRPGHDVPDGGNGSCGRAGGIQGG